MGGDGVQAAVDAALANVGKVGRAVIKDLLPPLGISDEVHRLVERELLAEEHAAQRLLTVMPPRLAETVQKEVERRCAVFTAANERSPRLQVVMPRRAALESVFDDLVKGRLS